MAKQQYLLTLTNNETRIFDEDIIIKYRLIPKKNITSKQIVQMEFEQEYLYAYRLAIHYLNHKLRTKKEIEDHLKKNNISSQNIEWTKNRLEKEGYLNEEKYLEAYLNDAFRFQNDGPLKLIKKLEKLGLDSEKIKKALVKIPKEEWLEKLYRLYQKKANVKHQEGLKKWQQKCIHYFILLGYPKEWLDDLTDQIAWPDETDLKEKELEKLRNKLSRKYSGKELEFQIKRKLYAKGFHVE